MLLSADEMSIIGLRDEMAIVIHQVHHLQRSQTEIITYLQEDPSDDVLREVSMFDAHISQ